MRSLSLTPGPSSDCVLAGFPGPAAAGMRLSGSSNVAAPGRCAHHPGITPGGVICGDRDNSPMGRGVRVASPRVPASTLISHRRGGVRGSFCAATSSARFARQRFHDRSCRLWRPGLSLAERLANGRATPGPARPYHRQPPAMPLSTRSSAPGLPWGSQSGARETATPARKTSQQGSGVPGPPTVPGICPKRVSGAK